MPNRMGNKMLPVNEPMRPTIIIIDIAKALKIKKNKNIIDKNH